MREHEPTTIAETDLDVSSSGLEAEVDLSEAGVDDGSETNSNLSGLSSYCIYMQELANIPLLGADDELALLQSIDAGNLEAKKVMIESNLRLVIDVAKRYQGLGLDFSDLIQIGNEGLIYSVDKFNLKKGNKFSTYATQCIRGYIIRAIDNQANMIRRPVYIAQEYRVLTRTHAELSSQLGREPSIEELADELCILPDKVSELIVDWGTTDIYSIDNNIGRDDDSGAIANTIPSKEVSLDEQVIKKLNSELLTNAINQLPEGQRRVIELRYLCDNTLTVQEIADRMGVSRDVINKIAKKAIRGIQNKIDLDSIHSPIDFSSSF